MLENQPTRSRHSVSFQVALFGPKRWLATDEPERAVGEVWGRQLSQHNSVFFGEYRWKVAFIAI
jgi:hypothetical protein